MILSPLEDGESAETGTPVLPRYDFSEKEELAREEGRDDWDDVGVPSILNSEVTGFSGVSREDRQETVVLKCVPCSPFPAFTLPIVLERGD
jgi:hypothetical protein